MEIVAGSFTTAVRRPLGSLSIHSKSSNSLSSSSSSTSSHGKATKAALKSLDASASSENSRNENSGPWKPSVFRERNAIIFDEAMEEMLALKRANPIAEDDDEESPTKEPRTDEERLTWDDALARDGESKQYTIPIMSD